MAQPVLARTLRTTAVVVGLAFVLIQFVPYGWWHENPPVTLDATWPDDESEHIARESCYSCHSNETSWPIYSYVAPVSWMIRSDVEGGRDELNFSEWDRDDGEADDAIEAILEGTMPPGRYTMVNRGAALSAAERDHLIAALATMDAAR